MKHTHWLNTQTHTLILHAVLVSVDDGNNHAFENFKVFLNLEFLSVPWQLQIMLSSLLLKIEIFMSHPLYHTFLLDNSKAYDFI